MSQPKGTKREPISLAIKDSIRAFYLAHEKMSVSDMVSWAQEKYEIPFLPSTMRTILFPKPKNLPLWTAPQSSLTDRKRERPPSWPELELELSKWYASSTTLLKGHEIKAKAIELWQELAPKHYVGQKQPSFGDSWRDKFKSRHGFKSVSASNLDKFSENQAFSIANRVISAENLQPIHDEIATDLITWNRNSNLGPLDMATSPSPSRAPQLMLSDEKNPSSWNCTISAALDSQQVWSQLQGLADGVNLSDTSTSTTKSKVCQARNKSHHPGAFEGQVNRREIDDLTYSDYPSIPVVIEKPSNRSVSKCISNLLRKASNGQEYFLSDSLNSIINTMLSEVRAYKSFNLRSNYPSASSSFLNSFLRRIELNRIASIEALRLLQSAEIFKISQPQFKYWYEFESEVLFDSFLCFPSEYREPEDDYRIARSSWDNCEANATNCANPINLKQTSTHISRRRSHTIFSTRSKRGRVDILVSKFSTGGLPEAFDSTTQVIFRPKGVAQLRFLLHQHVTKEASIILTPKLSIRNTIPNNSTIFRIAATGTVKQLREMFSIGKASPSDCDTDGRSVINYALRQINVEVVNYLLDFVKEIDTYEWDETGYFVPLCALTVGRSFDIREGKIARLVQCFKYMLDKGADPTLPVLHRTRGAVSIFEVELLGGSRHAVEATINSEHFSINENLFKDKSEALLFLATYSKFSSSTNLETVPKVIFLLERGADIRYDDDDRSNCLHLALSSEDPGHMEGNRDECYDGQDFPIILMAFITAGADVEAVDAYGLTPSEIALQYGREDDWIQALAKCGYDPWEIFAVQGEDLFEFPGMGIFPAASINVRPTMLSFQEFSSQLESLMDFEFPDPRPKPDSEWWRECYGGICGIDECDTESECGSDYFGEFEAIDCGDYWEDINPNNYREADYRPINGDITWLAYTRRHKFIWYWPYVKRPCSCSDLSDSSDASGYDSEEDKYYSQGDQVGFSDDAEGDRNSENTAENIIRGEDWKE